MPAENGAVDFCNEMLETANRLPTMEEMWEAGYNAAEEKFSSTNSASVEIAARAVVSQWDEFGPEISLEESIENLRKALQLHA